MLYEDEPHEGEYYYEDELYEDESCEDESYENESREDESYEDESYEDEAYEDVSYIRKKKYWLNFVVFNDLENNYLEKTQRLPEIEVFLCFKKVFQNLRIFMYRVYLFKYEKIIILEP